MPRLTESTPGTLYPLPDPLGAVLKQLNTITELVREPHPAVAPTAQGVYLTAKEAAVYLNIAYSTFRKRAVKIRRQPGTGRYLREDLDQFASSLRPRRTR